MKDYNIFIGTIKKCNNIYCYEKYGEERYVGDCIIGHTEVGEIHRYVDTITENAILIKVGKKYIWLDLLTTFTEEFLVNLGIPINAFNTFPSTDNELFVDEESLAPYFENTEDKNLSVKGLKKEISRSQKNGIV